MLVRECCLLVAALAGSTFGFVPFNNVRRTSVDTSSRLKLYDTSNNIASSTTSMEIEGLIENGDVRGALAVLGDEQTKSISPQLGAKVLNAAASLGDDVSNGPNSSRLVSPIQERNLVKCYTLLKEKCTPGEQKGLFGSVDMSELPLPYTEGCSIEKLEEKTRLPLSAFRPNPNNSKLFAVGGALAVVVQLLLSKFLHIPPQPLFFATFAAVSTDQLLSGGSAGEKVLLSLFPAMEDRIIRHEAGHILTAHLLGCPVQALALGKWDAMTNQLESGTFSGLVSAGTSFFDPELNAAGMKGRIGRSIIDRYSVILMAGIAAEAMNFGESEGGSDDENSLAQFLTQTVQTNLNIPEQARWAATNALLLLREHRDAYDRLITVLKEKGSGDIGQVMMALEGLNT